MKKLKADFMQSTVNNILATVNKIIMSEGFYSPIMKDKINPEFIGIAHKLSSSKHKRQLIEQKRNSILRSLKFKVSLDLGLDKNLEEQQTRLREARSVHQRRLADQEFKREQQEKKKKKLRNLSTSAKEKRQTLKHNIKGSLYQIFTRNRNLREQERELSFIFQSKVKQSDQQRLLNNRVKYKQVKSMQRHSQNTVNHFYRTLNKQSLNNYKNWISEEKQKVQDFSEQIKKIESVILKVDSQIEKKKKKIAKIFSQIQTYTNQPLDIQSKCLPTCLRSTLSLASQSSKPKDLLLKRAKEVFDKN